MESVVAPPRLMCDCCGTDARYEYGGQTRQGLRWCHYCLGREHHEDPEHVAALKSGEYERD